MPPTSSTKTELENFVTRKTLEWAYKSGARAQTAGMESYPRQALRAAKARDPKMLAALEGGAKLLQTMSEEQAGPHGFDVGGIRVQHTEFQLWKNAYEVADNGGAKGSDFATAGRPYQWIYVMAGILAGIVY